MLWLFDPPRPSKHTSFLKGMQTHSKTNEETSQKQNKQSHTTSTRAKPSRKPPKNKRNIDFTICKKSAESSIDCEIYVFWGGVLHSSPLHLRACVCVQALTWSLVHIYKQKQMKIYINRPTLMVDRSEDKNAHIYYQM